jgi:hypothetical protein
MSMKSFGRWTAAFAGITLRKLEKLAAAGALGLAAFGVASQAGAGVMFTGQFGTGNTWNIYEAINTPLTWKDAKAFAETRSDPTGGTTVGNLVALQSVAENNFVHQQSGGGDKWIGLTDRAGAAPGASESLTSADPLTQGWAWVTGEPFSFQNWGAGEPNDASDGEDATHIRGDSLWNDHESGFAENDPPLTPPDPGSTLEANQLFGFIIEWRKNLAAQPPGFPMTRPDPPLGRVFPTPLARLPGPNGTASAWGALDVRDLGGSASTAVAIEKVLSPDGTRVTGTIPTFDVHDPENGGNQGTITAPQIAMVSDNPGTDDNDFQSVMKGTIRVPPRQGGNYTFNARTDDGFALRVLSQATPTSPLVQHKFTSARTGNVDEDGTLVFLAPTGDSNTQGVINLAPGTYDVEFIMYENGGGAFWEVTTQKGDFVNPTPGSTAQWLHLGNPATVPQVGPFTQPARLTANATVRNYDGGADTAEVISFLRTNVTPTAQGTVDEVVLKGIDAICCGRPGAGLPATQQNLFPNGGLDNFATVVTGSFEVLNTDGAPGETLTFGLFSDDHTGLHIVGRSFTQVADFTGDGDAILTNPEGSTDQWIVADFGTGNSNSFGLITLPEGTYQFEATQREGGGDSGLEVWVAAGNRLATGFSGAFFPLTTATLPQQFLAANVGLGLVAGPGTGPSQRPGDFNGDGSVNAADLAVWKTSFGTNAGADADGDGDSDGNDFLVWQRNLGSAATGANAAVPEPSALALVVCALAGAACRSRRR